MDNLPLLRDIHLPYGVSYFPPGYGWAVLAAAAATVLLLYCLLKIYRRKSKKLYALRIMEKNAGNNIKSAAALSELLRRICLARYKNAAALSGKLWIDFLNEHCSAKIAPGAARLLLYAPYVKNGENFTAGDYESLRAFCKKWIGENL